LNQQDPVEKRLLKVAEEKVKREITGEPVAAGAPEYQTYPPGTPPVEQETDVRDELLEAVDEASPPRGFFRQPTEPLIDSALKPLEPLTPMSDRDYADMVGAAMEPSNIMSPMMPDLEPRGEVSPRLRGFTSVAQPLQFTCPYGLGGQCCGCRYMPCNELTLAVLGHVSKDYSPGGRCSA